MNKKLYLRSLAAQGWYNFTEGLVYALTVRPTPENLIYKRKDLKFSIAGNYLLLIDGRIIYL